ncbi:MAG: hypothetical protein H7Y27_06440, partial [Gemmatimonadaceae bacterium]|nr:hypothetical protein [Chitinophagaceae bacterium]
MKKYITLLAAAALLVFLYAAKKTNSNPYGLQKGNPAIKSIGSLSFGPDGVLIIGDSKSAALFAVDTKDRTAPEKAAPVEIQRIDEKIAAALGTEIKNIKIQDIAINPISKKLYCSVQNIDGSSVLLSYQDGKFSAVNLSDVEFSKADISNAPAEDQKDRQGRSLRDGVISDLQYSNGSVLVSGISNQEFGSTFRKMAFPFTGKQDHASLEIYHAAHGKYETSSPIRTFTTATLNGKEYLVASYTCTPLVIFPMDELQPGKHVKGRTVGEFGAGNSPIDMITISKGGNNYLVMANTNRPVMRVKYKSIEDFAGSVTEPIKESYSTAGVDFVTLPVVNVVQMDKLDDT